MCAIGYIVFALSVVQILNVAVAFSIPSSSASASKGSEANNDKIISTATTATTSEIMTSSSSSRRDFIVSSSSASAAAVAGIISSALMIDPISTHSIAAATATDESSLVPYVDKNCKFSINVPSEWIQTEQTLPDRRKINLWFQPESNQKTLMFIAYTPTRDDFTSLSSFGSVEEVGQSTILPKSEIAAKQGIESEMLNSFSKKRAYYFDYTQQTPVQPKTHFQTIFSLVDGATGGAGSILVSITVQTPEDQYKQLEPFFKKILDSYEPSSE